ncbi:MAG: hypothetical protein HOW97_12860 [Catenulispora sp.]|nr:hypothetical protein [Catenulispora sp.]
MIIRRTILIFAILLATRVAGGAATVQAADTPTGGTGTGVVVTDPVPADPSGPGDQGWN